jgi:hypothetical protein
MSIRFTVIDEEGGISFCGPGHGIKMVTAATSRGAENHRDLLDELRALDECFADSVFRGLTIFDEHCLRARPETVADWTSRRTNFAEVPFRVLDGVTRRASLDPNRLGLLIFNLNERRIIQVQNSYGAIQRCDRGRIRDRGRPTGRFYHYQLPDSWEIVP